MIAFLGILIGVLGVLLVQQWVIPEGSSSTLSPIEALKSKSQNAISSVEKILAKEYFDDQKLLEQKEAMELGAIKGFVDALNDPYTLYLDAEQMSGLSQELEGETDFEGIGAVIEKKEYYIQVAEVLKNSPAFKAGIQPLDRIVMINTGETREIDIYEAVRRIAGPQGTTVDLMIERLDKEGEKSYLTVTVTRELIQIPSLKYRIEKVQNQSIWFIEILVFGEKTEALLNAAIREFIDTGIDGIVLDLRGNGGGLMLSAVDIAKHFLERGKLVVSAQYRRYEDMNYYANGFWELKDYPLVVLIDGMTASAGEILALALHEQNNAPLIGSQSFGKGSIQTMQDFPGGESLKYTVGNRYSPNGTNVNSQGVTPSLEVAFDLTGYVEQHLDNQMEAAKSLLLDQILGGSDSESETLEE